MSTKTLRSNSSSSAPPGGFDASGRRRSLSRFFTEMQKETMTTGSTYNEGERQTRRDSFEKRIGGPGNWTTSGNVKSYAIFSDSEDDEEDTEDLEDKILRRQLALEEHERRMKRRQERGIGEEEDEDDEEDYDDGRDYFRFCQEKRATSNHSFSLALKAPIQELLELTVKKRHHEAQEKKIRMDIRSEFSRWRAQLLEGFNLVLHGLGSKKFVLEKFASHHRFGVSRYGEVFVMNGYFQASLVSQLLRLLEASLGFKLRGGNLIEQCQYARQQIAARERLGLRVFIMINNIDAPPLRNSQDQMMLSLLAEMNNVHIVATVDHINAAALWDGEMAGRFNWLWHEVTTFANYTYETKHDSDLKLGNMAASNTRGVAYVLSSLTENARKIFSVLAEHQLESPDSPGLTFAQWFSVCEEKLYTTSETTMLHQLRELTDHKIVLKKKGKTGLEYLHLNLSTAAISQTLSEITTHENG